MVCLPSCLLGGKCMQIPTAATTPESSRYTMWFAESCSPPLLLRRQSRRIRYWDHYRDPVRPHGWYCFCVRTWRKIYCCTVTAYGMRFWVYALEKWVPLVRFLASARDCNCMIRDDTFVPARLAVSIVSNRTYRNPFRPNERRSVKRISVGTKSTLRQP